MSDQQKRIFAIHGAGMDAAVWGTMAAGLKFSCHACSLPGHGAAEGRLIASIKEMSAWVNAQLSGHPPQSVVLMGHSMGALVALESARHPSVLSLILLGAAARMPVHPELLRQAAEDRDAAMDMILKWGVSNAHAQAEAIRTALKKQMQVAAQDALRNDLAACHAYQNGEAAARSIPHPALVLSGQDDKMAKTADGKILAEMMQQAQFRVLPDCGHMMMAEQPSAATAEINGFLSLL